MHLQIREDRLRLIKEKLGNQFSNFVMGYINPSNIMPILCFYWILAVPVLFLIPQYNLVAQIYLSNYIEQLMQQPGFSAPNMSIFNSYLSRGEVENRLSVISQVSYFHQMNLIPSHHRCFRLPSSSFFSFGEFWKLAE